MAYENQATSSPNASLSPGSPSPPTRAVLYADEPRHGLLRCGRAAHLKGERIVSAVSKDEDRRAGRQALYALVERMLGGEFETIIAEVTSEAGSKQGSHLIRLSCAAAEQ